MVEYYSTNDASIRIVPQWTQRPIERSAGSEPRRSDDDDREPSQGWGPRIISLEQKVIDLQSQINGADVRITARFVGAEGRLNAIDAAMPQRFANIEQRQI